MFDGDVILAVIHIFYLDLRMYIYTRMYIYVYVYLDFELICETTHFQALPLHLLA